MLLQHRVYWLQANSKIELELPCLQKTWPWNLFKAKGTIRTCHKDSQWHIHINHWVGWFRLVVLRIKVDLVIFQPYLNLEAGDNQSLKIQVARLGIKPRSSCSANQELNHSATAAPSITEEKIFINNFHH